MSGSPTLHTKTTVLARRIQDVRLTGLPFTLRSAGNLCIAGRRWAEPYIGIVELDGSQPEVDAMNQSR